MQSLLQTFRYTIRLLLKSPGFTITAILILGFGIGANTAIYSLIDAAVFRPLSMPQADRLVQIDQIRGSSQIEAGLSYPDYLDISRTQKSFDHIAVTSWGYFDLGRGDRPERITAIFATPSLFNVTALPMIMDRAFDSNEDISGAPLVVVLSEELWREKFNEDKQIIGKKIVLSDRTFEVIGVCRRLVEGLETPKLNPLYVPLHVTELFGGELVKRDDWGWHCFARLEASVTLDGGALLFSAAAIAFAAVGCGILPALSLSKTDAGAVLNDHGGRTGSFGPRQNCFLSILVAAQVALSCVLLIGAGLLMRSLQKAVDRPLGFNPHHVLTAEIQPTSGKYQSDVRKLRSLYDLVLEKARQLPGVTDAAMNDDRPFEWTRGGLNVAFWVIGQPQPQQGKEPTLDSQNISPGYFKTLEIPLLMGRDIQESDREESAKVIVIDQALAQRFFEEKNPLGRQIHIHDSWLGDGDFTIIGVVQNTLHNRPDNAPAPFQAYFSYHQRNIYREFLILQTASDPAALMPLIQKIVSSIDPGIPATRVETFDDFVMGRYEARVFAISLMQLVSGPRFSCLAWDSTASWLIQ